MIIHEEVKEVVDRFRMMFLNDMRGCVFRKDVTVGLTDNRQLGPFHEGDHADLPNWIIEMLLKHNLVDIVPEDAFDSLRRVENLYLAEEKVPHKLQSFHPHLYAALSRKLLRLQSDKTSLDPRSYDEIDKLKRVIPFLLESRLSKILRTAKSGAYIEMRKQMANEERWLCEELANLLSQWRDDVMA
ncbi:MAG: hypothetical protein C4K47_03325 [Candidatus Thorarchaeota archaeon]|nr:MAG: hypothetical protein C4K47_03325 [Candidatus Thorarchaeota archaeon]